MIIWFYKSLAYTSTRLEVNNHDEMINDNKNSIIAIFFSNPLKLEHLLLNLVKNLFNNR